LRFTLDTNVLVYAVDVAAGARRQTALDVLRRATQADCVLTLQCLGEFFDTVTRKGKLSLAEAEDFLNEWRAVLPVHTADGQTLSGAIGLVKRHGVSFWDAMLWTTARQAGCRLLLSEDLQDGQTLGGVTSVNPFASRNATLLAAVLPPTG
jgi:predicted nucleic acid-binding protein